MSEIPLNTRPSDYKYEIVVISHEICLIDLGYYNFKWDCYEDFIEEVDKIYNLFVEWDCKTMMDTSWLDAFHYYYKNVYKKEEVIAWAK